MIDVQLTEGNVAVVVNVDLDVDVAEIRNTIASFEFNKNENRKRS